MALYILFVKQNKIFSLKRNHTQKYHFSYVYISSFAKNTNTKTRLQLFYETGFTERQATTLLSKVTYYLKVICHDPFMFNKFPLRGRNNT